MVPLQLIFLFLVLSLFGVLGLDNGLAQTTPPMGISTWSIFRGNVNHTLIVDLADTMVSLGILNAGYTYLLMDAGWSTTQEDCPECLPGRDRDGHLLVDRKKFPNLRETIDYVHSKGLLFGIWFGAGMCADTNDHKLQPTRKSKRNAIDYATMDANWFASIGVDAIKHDSCNNVENSTQGILHNFHKYEALSLALNKTGRPILYDVTLQVNKNRSVPAYDYNYIWSPEPYGQDNVQRIANTWWSCPVNKFNCWRCCVHPNEFIVQDESDCDSNLHKLAIWRGLLPMLDVQDMGTPGWKGHWDWAGRGKGWNHLDQLSVCVGKSWYGPGLTPSEQVSQISLWAIVASPMIVSVDTRSMVKGDFCYNLITNNLLISVHQDPLGIPGRPRKNNYVNENVIDTQLWAKPLSKGAVAVVFFNRAEEQRAIKASFEEVGLSMSITSVTTTNVWTGEVIHGITSPVTATSVEPHGVTFLILTPEGMILEE